MSQASEQMERMTAEDIKKNPCGFCYACDWTTQNKCYEGNPAQCSICAIILMVIDKAQTEAAVKALEDFWDDVEYLEDAGTMREHIEKYASKLKNREE